MVPYENFAALDIRAGIVVRAEEFARAKNPSYKVWVDFGPEIGTLATSAQITKKYTADALAGHRVLGLVNIGSRNIAGFQSQFLLLGLHDQAGAVHLVTYEDPCLQGAKLS